MRAMVFSWKISGEAGFGITTIGLTFARLCARHGLQIADYAEYPSLIRGGFTTFELTCSDDNTQTQKNTLDVLICLRQDGFDRDVSRLTPHSVVLYDKDTVHVSGDFVQIPLPLKDIRTKYKAFQVMANTIAIGASLAVLGWDPAGFERLVEEEFSSKGQEVVEHNKLLAKEGFEYVVSMLKNDEDLCAKINNLMQENLLIKNHARTLIEPVSMVLSGNEAFSLGSVLAQCKAYFAYPMSPASSVLSTLASYAKHTGMVVRHVEDEIAAISEALGSAFAGVRSSVGTSGGGFALMTESISYAGVAEIPIVIYLAQRPGPATGLPTWTAQGDLLFAIHAGHGEFPKIVLSPGDIEEMVQLTAKAYDLADIYQTPVLIVSDKLLVESHYSVNNAWYESFKKSHTIHRGKVVAETKQNPYFRYGDSADGISEYLIPGVQAETHWQANSYEHTQDSHTTEEAHEVVLQVEKRKRKMVTYLNTHFEGPHIYGDLSQAHIIFVSYGTNKHAILYAQKLLHERGLHVGFLHFTHLYPLREDVIVPHFNKKATYVLVENSAEGQLAKLLKQECGIHIEKKILKYDGRPITADEIVKFASQLTL